MTVYFSVLSERTIAEKPFRKFMAMAVRAGELGYRWLDCPRMRTDVARDQICAEFMRISSDPNDILIMLDCDHRHPTDILERLVANDVPVVAAYAVKSDPTNPAPCFWVRDTNGILRIPREVEKKLIQVAITGSGAIAIKRSTLEALDRAGFDQMKFFYQYPPDGTRVSDEIAFSQMCEQVGIPVYVDTRIVTPHCVDAELDDTSWEECIRDHPIAKRERRVSVIVPLRGRLEKTQKMLDTLFATAPNVECILLQDLDDRELDGFTEPRAMILLGERKRAIDKWNEGAVAATGDVLVVAGNDVEFGDKWLDCALEALDSVPDGNAMVAFNDTITTPEVSSPHFLMSREYIVKYNGGVLMPPVYKKQFPDVENRLRAQSLGRYVCAKASIVKHLHPLTNTASMDEVYKEGLDTFEEDQKLCAERQKQEFPITWSPMLK